MRFKRFDNRLSCLYLGNMLETFERLGLLKIGIAEYDIDDGGFVLYLHLETGDEKFIMTRRGSCDE